MSNINRAPAVNTDRLAFAKLLTDTGNTLAYGEVNEMEKSIITVSKTPKQNSASQYASGQPVASYVAKNGGELQITVPALNDDDELLLFGKHKDEPTGVVTNNKDDIVPALMTIYSTTRSDGTKNLYKVMKAKFVEGAETVQTSDESGIKYQALQITAKYENLIKNGDDVHTKRGVDPETEEGRELIEAWFGSALGGLPADKYSETCTVTITGATEADYITAGGNKINSGATVAKGSTLTVVLATAGTTCTSGGNSLSNGATLTVNSDTTIAFTAG